MSNELWLEIMSNFRLGEQTLMSIFLENGNELLVDKHDEIIADESITKIIAQKYTSYFLTGQIVQITYW